FLAIQILELTPNVILVFTKVDEAHSKGIHIHYDKLEQYLGIPVVPVSSIKGEGIRELLRTITDFRRRVRRREPLNLDYDGLNYFINDILDALSESKALKDYPPRWAAVRLLEGDERLEELLVSAGEREVLHKVGRVRESALRSLGTDVAGFIMRTRFEFGDSLIRKVVVRAEVSQEGKVDIFQRPVIGPLVSIGMLFTVFLTIFSVNTGFPLNIIADYMGMHSLAEAIETYSISGLMDMLFTSMSDGVTAVLTPLAPHWVVSLITDGLIAGVGAVLSFFPLILMVFLFLAILEDTGIAPRMAMAFHPIFSKFGLSGRAIYPYLISLGCNVPGVLVSRASLEEQERYEVMISVPFIPCQARLIVALAFASALSRSPIIQAGVLLLVYAAGIGAALLTSLIMRRAYFKIKENPELILELPPLHKPKLKVVWWLTWDNTKHFLRKAGIIIFSLSIIVWALLYLGPQGYLPDIYSSNFFQYSYASLLGKAVAPLLEPLGMSADQAWRVGFALINGFLAKEVILSSLAMLYGKSDAVGALVALGLNMPQMVSILIFITLYVPCMATLAVLYQESRSAKLTAAAILYMMGVAYLASLATYFIISAIYGLV
ncbi:MAG: ferrous iron transport protein B, partial [Desulfurococcales archaeon]|nr:ferrous iron transport protein B [Desulfurococcales archaeon]